MAPEEKARRPASRGAGRRSRPREPATETTEEAAAPRGDEAAATAAGGGPQLSPTEREALRRKLQKKFH